MPSVYCDKHEPKASGDLATIDFSLANVYKSANLLHEAAGTYRRALVADPTHNGAALNLGIALESQVLHSRLGKATLNLCSA